MAFNKNEHDGAPAFNVDLTPTAPPNTPLSGPRWYQAEWTTDQALFANTAARTAQNFWTDGTHQSQTRNFRVTLPGPIWDFFRPQRHLYFRVGAGTAQDMSNWSWSVVTDIVINHNPTAHAGEDQRVPTPTGTVISAVTLDGSGSNDPDGGTLTYTWRLTASPPTCFDQAFLDAISARLAAGGIQVTPFPAGTSIDTSCEGSYTFELEVADNDPPSFSVNTRGVGTATTNVTIGSVLNRIQIDAPTSAAPFNFIRPENTDVRIVWRMDPELHRQLQIQAPSNHRLRLSIAETGGAMIYTEFEIPVPESGEFVWPATKSDGSLAGAGTYDLRLELLDHLDMPLTIVGFDTFTEQAAAVTIDTFTAKIDRRLSASVIQLWAPGAIAYEVNAPLPPDEIKLIITGGTLLTPQETILPTLAAVIPWTPPNHGIYQAKIEVRRTGVVVATSEVHEIVALDDPVTPTLNLGPVGSTTYTALSDAMAPAAVLTQTIGAGDGYPAAFTIDIAGMVRYPATMAGVNTPVAGGAHPLVFVVHGNHRTGVDSFTGFTHLLDHLAAQGFIAVSINQERLNGGFFPTINTRADVLNTHIRRWIWKAASDPLFAGHVDLSRIGLVGHSRGGEAVVRAPILGVPAGATVRCAVSISPTDFLTMTPVTPFLAIYGSIDADVITAGGFALYDRAGAPKAQAFVYGATHNDFCDHPDWLAESSGPGSLPKGTVLAAERGYVGAFLHWQLRGRAEDALWFEQRNTPRSLPASTVVKCVELPGAVTIDRFLSAPIETTDVPSVASPIPAGSLVPFVHTDLRFSFVFPTTTTVTPFFQQATNGGRVGWTAAAGYQIDLGGANLSAVRVISARVAQAMSAGVPAADPRNPLGLPKLLRLRLRDTAGKEATVEFAAFGAAPPYPFVRSDTPNPMRSPFTAAQAAENTKSAFLSARIPVWAFKAVEPKIDLTAIQWMQFVLPATGLIVVTDILLSP